MGASGRQFSRPFNLLIRSRIAADEAEAYKVGGTQTEDGVVPQEVIRVMEGVSEVMAGEFQRGVDEMVREARAGGGRSWPATACDFY